MKNWTKETVHIRICRKYAVFIHISRYFIPHGWC